MTTEISEAAAALLASHTKQVVSDASCELVADIHDETWLTIYQIGQAGITIETLSKLLALSALITEAARVEAERMAGLNARGAA